MGNRKISDDAKEISLRLRARGLDSRKEILKLVGFSQSTYYRTIRRKQATGSVAKAEVLGRGRPRKILHSDSQYLLRLARHKPTLFLDEYADRLRRYRFLPVSLATIHRAFKRAGLSVKRAQKLASERDPDKRANFVRRIGQYPANYLIMIDEVSKDDRTYARLWGRATVGERVEAHNPFVRKRRLSLVAAMALDEGIIASKVVEGSFHRDSFLEFLRDGVVSTLAYHLQTLWLITVFQLPMTTPYPGPRSVLVLDNARIHHAQEIEDLIHDYGVFSVYPCLLL
jgi:transposase